VKLAPSKTITFLCALLCGSSPAIASAVAETPRTAMEKILFGDLAGVHTDAFLILKDGKIVYERYARGYGPASKHLSWSMGKSIAGIIAANAIDAGKFSMGDALHTWVPTYAGSATLLDVFQMSSGLAFREEYSGIPVDSDATKMLYLNGPKLGFANYTASLPLRADVKPGHYFSYSSGDANLIMETLRSAIGDSKTYDAYPWTAFFDRLGLPGATFEQDAKGTFVGSSYLYLTARGFARIGELLAQKGRWGEASLIPDWYFTLLNQVAPGVMENALPETSATRAYSVQTTTNLPITGRGLPSEYPNLPLDSLLLIGHQGQLVIASPSEQLVIVRLATDKGDPFNPYRDSLFYAVRNFLAADLGISIRGAGDVDGRPTLPGVTEVPPNTGPKSKWKDYLKVPRLMRALYAKELCSCTFVLGRALDDCRTDLKITLPILPRASIDRRRGTVTTTFTGLTHSRAIYRGTRLGCTLLR
jgi:CubicO group peptidase (beta-lactamase class C family)